MKILLVDDSAVMRKMVGKQLQQAIPDVEIVEAGDGEEALGHVKAQDFTLVITDWNMPKMNGLDFIKSMKATPQGQAMPVMMLSTEATPDKIEAATEAGAVGYLTKPFTPQTLREKLLEALNEA